MFKSFDEIKKQMINPLDNPDFYAMILADNRYTYPGGAFSFCHNNDFGTTTFNDRRGFLYIAVKEYLNNINSFEIYKKVYPNGTKEGFERMKMVLSNGLKSPEELENLMKTKSKQLFKYLGLGKDFNQFKGWFYFDSKYLNPNNMNPILTENIKHRLYLTVDEPYRALMSKRIIEECNKRQLPYLFKVAMNFYQNEQKQSDTFAIYLKTEEQVVEYTNMINEIIAHNPDFQKHIHKPSPHMGIINNYLGYGFNPDYKSKMSYSQLIKRAIPVSYVKELQKGLLSQLSTANLIKNSEKAQHIYEIAKKEDNERKTEEIEELKRIYSNYFRRRNMNLKGISLIRLKIIEGLIKLYPDFPKDNFMGIDVEKVKEEIKNNNSQELK